MRCLLLVMCTHPFAKKALTLHLARSEGHERYFGCNLMHRKVLASSHQHLVAEAPALHVENLKGAPGEIALRVGDNDAFGVINVGDDAKLRKMCENHQSLIAGERDFAGSLFHDINRPHSTVNVLIGSKKFTEGWNSWRVSTMGLMNVGSTEGSQIIQLFGRGVRLKGHRRSLKRSGRTLLPEDLTRPRHIATLETLNIFGIKADYMAQFRELLEDEGLSPNDERTEILLPVIRNLGTRKLKTIRLKKTINGVSTEFGDAFKRLGPVPTLRKPDPDAEPATRYLQQNQVVVNWYPKIQALKSSGAAGGDQDGAPQHGYLSARHIAFLDLDALFFELHRFKAERAWHNFNLSREAIAELLQDQSWYRLLIPEEELAFDSFDRIRLWQEIAAALGKRSPQRSRSTASTTTRSARRSGSCRTLNTATSMVPTRTSRTATTSIRTATTVSWCRNRRSRLSRKLKNSKP